MELYMGRPILIGMPVGLDYKADIRVVTTVERWDRDDDKESYYASSDSPALGRDKIVYYAKYRIPSPSHILFIDSDVLPRRNTLERLLNLDKDIVTGVYHIATNKNVTWSVSREEGVFVELGGLPDNPFKIKSCGNGVILVKFEVFEKLQWPYWENQFAPGVKTMGEDIYFCEKAREAGYDIWCDPKVKCNHIRITNLMSVINNLKKGD